jgi:hypothetical protein
VGRARNTPTLNRGETGAELSRALSDVERLFLVLRARRSWDCTVMGRPRGLSAIKS